MSPGDPTRDDVVRPARDGPEPGRRRAGIWWPPRPATVVAAMIVGSSLIWMNLGAGGELASFLAARYGWPFSYHLWLSPHPGTAGALIAAAAMAADLVISAALLAAACATTQIAAVLLAPSPRVNVRHLVLWVFLMSLFLAACRLKADFLIHSLLAGFCYGLASLIALALCLLLRMELPLRDASEQGGKALDRRP